MNMKSLKTQFIGAIAMVLVAAIAMGSSTYAWFTMNNTVKVTGMEVKTKVNDNLLIAPSTAGTTKSGDNTFVKEINQISRHLLQPTSTINAAKDSYFYTYDAKADGSKNVTNLTAVPYQAVPTTGEHPYQVPVGAEYYDAFADYVYEIKAINASDAAKYLSLTKLNLLYDGIALSDHAYRVAIFTQEQSGEAYAALATTDAADTIYAPTSFSYHGGTAVSATDATAAMTVTVNNETDWAKAVAAKSTKYFKITVRLWLEGEDTDCYTSKFVDLDKEWTLDMEYELKDTATNSVNLIGSTANVTASIDGTTVTGPEANAIDGETIVAYQWYKDNAHALPDEALDGKTSKTLTVSTTGYYYCAVTTANGAVYRTNSVSYVAPAVP